ncbi:MAG: uroporphyrinogen decarboxylase family protein [Candidatus Methanomethylophilus sp.]|nr:uroporphyrinogen decarboxylase family protein [Methanomethylophilus sp.]
MAGVAADAAATDFCIEYGRQQVAAGAHILFPADPSASGDPISPETYKEFVLPCHQKFARAVSAPKILHMCRHTEKLLPYIRKSHMDCFSFDAPPAWLVRKELGNEMRCLGSLDVIDLMPRGTPEQVHARTAQCIREGVDIMGTACDVSNGTPSTNMKAYVAACYNTPIPDCCEVEDRIRALGAAKAKSLRALSALRTGQMTPMQAADVAPREVQTMYMAGASGTQVDPVKAQAVGIVPPDATMLVQVGNTSLELVKDLARDPDILSELNALRQQLLAEHIMFATSDVFRNLYVCELALWTEGMAPDCYRKLLEGYGLSGYLDDHVTPLV